MTPERPVKFLAIRQARSFASLPVHANITASRPAGIVATSRSAYSTIGSNR